MAKKTRKFSEFVQGNAIVTGDQTVGLRDNQNTIFDATTGGGGSGGGSVSQVITQANTFDIGDWVKHDGANYIKAQANSANNAESIGVVTAASTTEFTLTMAGFVDLSGSSLPYVPLTAGEVYFLSDSTSGEASLTEPTTLNYVSKPVMVAISTSEGWVIPYRGEILNGGVGPAGGGSGGSFVELNLPGHTFNTGDVIRVNGTNTYVKALADSALNAEAVGIVQKVDADNIILYTEGYMDTLSGLTANSLYYLSDTTAGLLTLTKPTNPASYDKPMLFTVDTGVGYVFSRRPDPISGPPANTQNVQQIGHGFSVGNFVRTDGADPLQPYVLAQADSLANSRAVGMVTHVADANNFTVQFGGYFDFGGIPSIAISAGTQYYLSEVAAGTYTSVEPNGAGEASKPVLSAISDTEVWILEQRPMLQPNANGGGGGGGAGVVVASATINNDTSVDFTGSMTTDYDYYEIVLRCVVVSVADSHISGRLGTPTYQNTLYSSAGSYAGLAGNTLSYSGIGNSFGAHPASSFPITYSTGAFRGLSNAADRTANARVTIWCPHDSSVYKLGHTLSSWNERGTTTGPSQNNMTWQWYSTAAVNSVQVIPTSGLLVSGEVSLIGYTDT